MMEIQVTYDDDDLDLFRHHQNAQKYLIAVDDVWSFCRTKLKHGLYDNKGKELDFGKEANKYIFDMLEEIQGMLCDAYNRGFE